MYFFLICSVEREEGGGGGGRGGGYKYFNVNIIIAERFVKNVIIQ